jgi:hypothetical protein
MFTQPAPAVDLDGPAHAGPVPVPPIHHVAPAAPAAPVFAQTPTGQQTVILDAARTGAGLVIEAGAGTGKTTTLKMAAQVTRGRCLYVAYNKAIADDARGSFPSGTHCSTAHSLAFQSVGRRFSHRLNSPRLPSREVARKLRIPAVVDLGANALTNVKVARVVMDTVARFCHSSDVDIYTTHVPDLPGLTPESATALRMEVVPLARHAWQDLTDPDGALRFTHDVYLKMWALGHPVLPYGTVFLDEAQDANPVIADVVMRQEVQRILVGDRSQAIYGWRGAVDAMDDFLATGAQRFALTRSWRFGQAIADEANTWLDLLDAPLRLTGNPDRASTLEGLEHADAILCRTNAGAIAHVITALDAGKTAAMVGGGKEIRMLAEACRDLRAGRGTSHPELMAFNTWSEVLEYVEHDAGGSDLKVFVKLIESRGPIEIIRVVDQLSAEPDAQVVVSTAHKAKGREWPTVRLADDFGVYVDEAGAIIPAEVMLRYVAGTRAQNTLDTGQPQPGGLFDAPDEVVHRTPLDQAHAPEIPADSAPVDSEQGTPGRAVELPAELVGWLTFRKDAKANKEQWAKLQTQAEEKIQDWLGKHEQATVDGVPAVSWKTSLPGTQLDGAALKRDYPDLYEQYAKPKKAARPFKLLGPWAE